MPETSSSGRPTGVPQRNDPRHQRLFEAERVAFILVVLVVAAELAVAGLAIARNRPVILLVNLEPQVETVARQRCFFRGAQERRSNAVAGTVRRHRNGVQTRNGAVRSKQDHG